jgi:hypothetical protein
MEFKNNYPKVEYLGPDFLTDTSTIRNLIFALQQVTIMQVIATWLRRRLLRKLLETLQANSGCED